jgi:hypothetical protein
MVNEFGLGLRLGHLGVGKDRAEALASAAFDLVDWAAEVIAGTHIYMADLDEERRQKVAFALQNVLDAAKELKRRNHQVAHPLRLQCATAREFWNCMSQLRAMISVLLKQAY